MTNAEVLNLIMARFGGRTAPALRAQVLKELNEKIRQLETASVLPHWIEDRWEEVTVGSQDYLALPASFSREVEEGRVKVKNSEGKWYRLAKVDYETLEDETENFDPALPEGYALFGTRMYFGPTPDKAYDIKVPYYKHTDPIQDNSAEVTNPWLIYAFNYTTLATAQIVATLHIQSAEMVQKIAPELKTAFDIYWRAVEARKHTNMEYLLGNSES